MNNRETGQNRSLVWSYHDFRGDRCCSVANADHPRYLLNAYRVLLTRTRQGPPSPGFGAVINLSLVEMRAWPHRRARRLLRGWILIAPERLNEIGEDQTPVSTRTRALEITLIWGALREAPSPPASKGLRDYGPRAMAHGPWTGEKTLKSALGRRHLQVVQLQLKLQP
jgi:hypothetical protein